MIDKRIADITGNAKQKHNEHPSILNVSDIKRIKSMLYVGTALAERVLEQEGNTISETLCTRWYGLCDEIQAFLEEGAWPLDEE